MPNAHLRESAHGLAFPAPPPAVALFRAHLSGQVYDLGQHAGQYKMLFDKSGFVPIPIHVTLKFKKPC